MGRDLKKDLETVTRKGKRQIVKGLLIEARTRFLTAESGSE